MATYNWRFRPYVVPETIFAAPRQVPYQDQGSLGLMAPEPSLLQTAYNATPKPWSRYPAGLPVPGYEPTAFVYQSSLPTALQYLVLLGLFSQAALFVTRHCPANLFPRLLPSAFLTNRNWFLFAHKGT